MRLVADLARERDRLIERDAGIVETTVVSRRVASVYFSGTTMIRADGASAAMRAPPVAMRLATS